MNGSLPIPVIALVVCMAIEGCNSGSADIAIEIREFALPNGANVEMVYVPEGTFTMGGGGGSTARPVHEVYLDAYWIDRTEVTNRQYAACVDEGECAPPASMISSTRDFYYGDPAFDDYPVNNVVWLDAQRYCEWRGARLPTEAEWEKAARGVDARTYPWGEEFDCELAAAGSCGPPRTEVVGSYPGGASPYGALDMAGNVEEWTADWYDGDYYEVSPASNPEGPDSGSAKVKRGGSWFNYYTRLVTYKRGFGHPSDNKYGDLVGFRCASSPDDS